jgi:hypothetical protein
MRAAVLVRPGVVRRRGFARHGVMLRAVRDPRVKAGSSRVFPGYSILGDTCLVPRQNNQGSSRDPLMPMEPRDLFPILEYRDALYSHYL